MAGGHTRCQRVLLVEDDRDTRDSLRQVLLLAGVAEVQSATSVEEAEQILHAGFKPSVFILDLLLDGDRGETFAASLKADPAHAATPIVAVSGDYQRLHALGSKFERGFLKPVDPEELVDALDELCGAA